MRCTTFFFIFIYLFFNIESDSSPASFVTTCYNSYILLLWPPTDDSSKAVARTFNFARQCVGGLRPRGWPIMELMTETWNLKRFDLWNPVLIAYMKCIILIDLINISLKPLLLYSVIINLHQWLVFMFENQSVLLHGGFHHDLMGFFVGFFMGFNGIFHGIYPLVMTNCPIIANIRGHW